MRLKNILFASSLALSTAFAASAEITAFTGADVWTGTGEGMIEDGTVLIEDGVVLAVGAGIPVPAGATTVDASGKWITPGIIASFSRVGLVEVPAEDSTNDTSAGGSKFSVALDASKSFNPAATPIDVTRIEGVTRVIVAPNASSSLFAGRGFAADTSGDLRTSMTAPRLFQFMVLGESGAGRSGGSRDSAWRYLNGALLDARTFPARYLTHDLGDSLRRADAEALQPVIRGEMPLVIQANRASDLLEIVRFKEANQRLNIVIVGAVEGWMVAEDLAEAGIPVIVDPFNNLPASFEKLGATMHNAERLIEAGVQTAFMHFEDDGHQARLVLQSAGIAVANGVDFDDAMMAITSVPASIFGLSDLGSLAPGNRADLVIWDGDPLEVMTTTEAVYIDGVEQSLESRQTKLRDRYLNADLTEKPAAFER